MCAPRLQSFGRGVQSFGRGVRLASISLGLISWTLDQIATREAVGMANDVKYDDHEAPRSQQGSHDQKQLDGA